MVKSFELTPFGSKLIVVVDPHPGKAATKLNIENPGLDIDYPHEYAVGVTFERFYKGKKDKGLRQYIVVVMNTAHADPSTIAHEAVHVVNYLFEHSGVEHDYSNDEPQAYMTGYVTECIWNTLK